MSDPFRGFPAETFRFLKGLAAHNEKRWFDAHRADYDAYCMAPARAFVVALGERLRKSVPAIQAEPKVNGSIGRINRDTRFSKDKRPYNTHLKFRFWDGPETKKTGPGLFIWMGAEQAHIGGGLYEFDKPTLAAYRRAVAADASGKALQQAVNKLERAGLSVHGEQYKRVPKGYPAEHPRAQLLRHGGLYGAQAEDLPKSVGGTAFVEFVAKRIERVLPLHGWIMTHLRGR